MLFTSRPVPCATSLTGQEKYPNEDYRLLGIISSVEDMGLETQTGQWAPRVPRRVGVPGPSKWPFEIPV